MQKLPPVFVQARLYLGVSSFQLPSQMSDFHKTWCGNCAIGEHRLVYQFPTFGNSSMVDE